MSYEFKLLLAILMWGGNYVIIPYGLGPFGAGPFTFLRFGLTLPILFLLLLHRGDFFIAFEDWKKMALIGLLGTAGYQVTFAAAVEATTTTNAAILFSLSPIFSVLINRLSGREIPGWTNWLGLFLAFSGGLILVLSEGGSFTINSSQKKGDLLMLAAALLWALTAFFSEGCLRKYGGLKVTAWSLPFGVAGLALYAAFDTASLDFSSLPSTAWVALLFAILGATVIGVVFFYDALPHMGTRQVMTYMYLIPVIAILTECAVFGLKLNGMQISGAVLALLGVALARKKIKPSGNLDVLPSTAGMVRNINERM